MPTPDRRRAEVEAWYALIFRIGLSLLGAAGFARLLFFPPPQDRYVTLALIAASVAAMGPLVAASFAQIVAAFRQGSGGQDQ